MSSNARTPLIVALLLAILGLGIWLMATPSGKPPDGAASFPPAASASGATGQPASERGVSPSCAECEAKFCSAERGGCRESVGLAADGPRKGTARSALCEEVLACVRKTGCAPGARGVGNECYCGKDDVQKCITEATADGPCKEVIEAAAESTSPMTVGQRWGKAEFALGAAFRRVRCAGDRCRAECFPGVLAPGHGQPM